MRKILFIPEFHNARFNPDLVGQIGDVNFKIADTYETLIEAIETNDFDVVLSPYTLSQNPGTEILRMVLQRNPGCPVIFYGGPASHKSMREAWQAGAFDYIPKPVKPGEVLSSISRALKLKSILDEKEQLESEKMMLLNDLKDLVNLHPDFMISTEEKYRTMHETMLTGVLYLDNQERVTAANPAAERLIGIPYDKMEEKSFSSLLYMPLQHDGSPFRIDELPSRKVLLTGKAVSNVIIGMRNRRSKRYHWAVVNTVPQFKADENKPYRILLTIDDITHIKETEEALLRSEQKNLAILNALPDMMLRLNSQDLILDVKNPQADIFNQSITVGDKLSDVAPVSFCELTRYFMKQALSELSIQKFDYQSVQNGEVKYFEIRMVNSGENEVLSIIRNVTDQKRFELDLQKSEKKFRILLESASQAILLVDIHGQIVLVNAQLERIFGYERDDLIDHSIELLLPVSIRDTHAMKRSAYFTHPASRIMAPGMTISARRKDGSEFPVEVSLSAIELYEGIFVMAFITDISDRKKFENRIRQVEKLEAIGQLAGGIAHDFNNVLAGIMGLSELALRKISPDNPAAETLNVIIKKSESAANLVRQLLTFSRKRSLSTNAVMLNSSIQHNYKLLERYLGEDIKLITRFDPHLPYINADLTAIDQIITNLCINARDAMPDGGELIIETQLVQYDEIQASLMGDIPPGAYVRMTVIDTGIGMRQEILSHIFEPFFTTKDIGEGTGLGLSIIYGLLKQHNAYIQCESHLGEGTRFDLYFPAVDGTGQMPVLHSPVNVKRGDETILVVEDESDVLLSVKDALESGGYKVLSAYNGYNALDVLEKHPDKIHLIISDIIMPNMGGIELHLRVRRMLPDLKFLFMSAYNDKLSDDSPYLQKPFSTHALLQRVREILDQN